MAWKALLEMKKGHALVLLPQSQCGAGSCLLEHKPRLSFKPEVDFHGHPIKLRPKKTHVLESG